MFYLETLSPVKAKLMIDDKTSAVCFHCLDPIPNFSKIFAEIDGRKQAMCCYGCKAAVEFIDGRNLGDFYTHRTHNGLNRFFAKVARKPVHEISSDQWTYLDSQTNAMEYVWIDRHGRRCIDLIVNGLYCSSCSWLIDKALTQISDAIEVRVQLDTKRATVIIDKSASSLKLSSVLQVISDLGYKPSPLTKHNRLEGIDRQRTIESQKSIKRILVAGFGMMQVMTYAIALYLGEVQGMDSTQHRFLTLVSMLVATVVVFYSGKPFFTNALNDLRNRHFGMDVPIALAIAGAYFPSVYDTLNGHGENIYFDSAVMFIFFLLIGRFVEIRARHRLSDAPGALMRLLPARVKIKRIRGSELKTYSLRPQDVEVGDQAVLNTGSVVPFDANIVGGEASVDESLLSGEVLPIAKKAGSSLLAGSKITSGLLMVEAQHAWPESSIVKVENLLNQGIGPDAQSSSKLQRFSQIFIIGILLLTILVGTFWSLYDASRVFEIVLAMLIASCPCAFALAIPIGSAAASNALRKQGVLLANLSALEKISDISRWCFDKTGTLTKGEASLQKVMILSALSEIECIDIAAALERESYHSLARAFIDIETSLIANDVKEIAGNGITGLVRGQHYFLGKRGWVLAQLESSQAIDLPPYNQRCSEMLLASESEVLALIFISDDLRIGVKETITFLKENNKEVSILSGDNQCAVQFLADSLAISDAFGSLLPEQKMHQIKSVQAINEVVAMVGDGLNDAPVMSQANLSIALASGSELTQSQADVILLNGRLDKLVTLHQIARLAKQITNQNLTWALSYNAIILPLAAFGFLSPWIAALGMSSSSLLVVLNALRIRTVEIR
jgi:Cu2+-exporting ATPase